MTLDPFEEALRTMPPPTRTPSRWMAVLIGLTVSLVLLALLFFTLFAG